MTQISSLSVGCLAGMLLNADDRIKQLKSENVEKFHMLVTMHLSFLMDLSDTGLEEILENNLQPNNEKTKSLFSMRKRNSKADSCLSARIFGARLTLEAVCRIHHIIVYLGKNENVQKEGLFRVSGSLERQKELRERLDSGETLDDFESKYFVNDYATVFKHFLKELPEPLLTEKYFNVYLQIAGMKNQNRQIQSLQLLIQLLPTENLLLLHHLLCLLNKISRQRQSKMTAENLAILFTPHLIVPRKTPVTELHQLTELLRVIVELMISRSDVLFSLPPPFVHDALHYCDEFAAAFRESSLSHRTPTSSSLRKAVNVLHDHQREDDEIVISTTYSFTDRRASQEAARQNNTESALSELYSHVSQMPESAQKRKILKEFSKVHGTPKSSYSSEKLKMPNSLESTIKRLMKKRKRLVMPSEIIDEDIHLEEPQLPHHPSFTKIRVSLPISSGDTPTVSTPIPESYNCAFMKKEIACEDSFSIFGFQDGAVPVNLSCQCLSFSEETTEADSAQNAISGTFSEDLNCDMLKIREQTVSKCCEIGASGSDTMRSNSSSCYHDDENKENSTDKNLKELFSHQEKSPSYLRLKGYISPLTFRSTTPQKSSHTNSLSSCLTRVEMTSKLH